MSGRSTCAGSGHRDHHYRPVTFTIGMTCGECLNGEHLRLILRHLVSRERSKYHATEEQGQGDLEHPKRTARSRCANNSCRLRICMYSRFLISTTRLRVSHGQDAATAPFARCLQIAPTRTGGGNRTSQM